MVELLRNSRDAHARRIFLASGREGDSARFTVVDDGVGIPSGMRDRVFEPRVTSKLETMVVDHWGVHGRGIALVSIRSNASNARVAAFPTSTRAPRDGGSRLFQLAASEPISPPGPSWSATKYRPVRVARGPHNIVRRVVEFSVDTPVLMLYFGSPTEIVATMFRSPRSI